MPAPAARVCLSTFDKAEDLHISDLAEGGLEVHGHKGFRSVRATHGVVEGDWYFEATVLSRTQEQGAVRLGWSTRRADTEGPVGRDIHGFGLRDKGGEFVHRKHLQVYGEAFGPGDIIGCRLKLPQHALDDDVKRRLLHADALWAVENGAGSSEPKRRTTKDVVSEGDTKIAGAWTSFSKNGCEFGIPPSQWDAGGQAGCESEPEAIGDGILAGVYYPTASVFKGGGVRLNFGPEFAYGKPVESQGYCECVAGPEMRV